MEQIEALLYSLPHYKKVIFAVYCCNDIKHFMNPESLKCLELLEKWLNDNESVSMEELRASSAHTHASHSAVDYSVNAVANANATTRDSATYSAANSAAAAYAAVNATYAANAKTKENKLVQYKTYLLKMIEELTPLEKEFI